MSKVTVKLDAALNKRLSICAILADSTKEKFLDRVLREGLKPYEEHLERYKFK